MHLSVQLVRVGSRQSACANDRQKTGTVATGSVKDTTANERVIVLMGESLRRHSRMKSGTERPRLSSRQCKRSQSDHSCHIEETGALESIVWQINDPKSANPHLCTGTARR
jgi:hypothetical protein